MKLSPNISFQLGLLMAKLASGEFSSLTALALVLEDLAEDARLESFGFKPQGLRNES